MGELLVITKQEKNISHKYLYENYTLIKNRIKES